MVSKSPLHLVEDAAGIRPKAITELVSRIGRSRFRLAFSNAIKVKLNDPYLLILLADQELVDGREQQARYLVEAAYEAFDRNAEPKTWPRHVAS